MAATSGHDCWQQIKIWFGPALWCCFLSEHKYQNVSTPKGHGTTNRDGWNCRRFVFGTDLWCFVSSPGLHDETVTIQHRFLWFWCVFLSETASRRVGARFAFYQDTGTRICMLQHRMLCSSMKCMQQHLCSGTEASKAVARGPHTR